MQWFRFYNAAHRNPKVASLSDKDFRLWVELLSEASVNEGLIPPLSILKHTLKRRLDHLSTGVERLFNNGLIDIIDGQMRPHDWAKHQYKSDSSAERVAKHRKKAGNGSVTPPETDTESDTETEPYPYQGSEFEGEGLRAHTRGVGPFKIVEGGK